MSVHFTGTSRDLADNMFLQNIAEAVVQHGPTPRLHIDSPVAQLLGKPPGLFKVLVSGGRDFGASAAEAGPCYFSQKLRGQNFYSQPQPAVNPWGTIQSGVRPGAINVLAAGGFTPGTAYAGRVVGNNGHGPLGPWDRPMDIDTDASFFRYILAKIHTNRPIDLLVHGTAKGADAVAAEFLHRHHVPVLGFPPDWATEGPKAGIMRNKQMFLCTDPDVVITMPGGRGTTHMRNTVQKAIASGNTKIRHLDYQKVPDWWTPLAQTAYQLGPLEEGWTSIGPGYHRINCGGDENINLARLALFHWYCARVDPGRVAQVWF